MDVYCQSSCKLCAPGVLSTGATSGHQAGGEDRGSSTSDRDHGSGRDHGSDRGQESNEGQGYNRGQESNRATGSDQDRGTNNGHGNDHGQGSHSVSTGGSSSGSSSGTTRAEVVDNKKQCDDTREHCSRWAEAGYCESRSQVMHAMCPASCNVCDGDNTGRAAATSAPTSTVRRTEPPTTTDPPTTRKTTTRMVTSRPANRGNSGSTNQKKCADISEERCRIWKEAGQCEKSQYYMKTNCPRTCGHCDDSASENTNKDKAASGSGQDDCEDKNKYCSLWARAQRCDLYAGYMKRNCAKSCGHCGSGQDNGSQSGKIADCTDQYTKYCGTWAKKGYCSIRREFMSNKCKKSCGLC